MKKKADGTSLIIVLIMGILLSGWAITLLNSINQIIDFQGKSEANVQSFLFLESAKEAGIFHHNSIGKGLKIIENYGKNPSISTNPKIQFEIISRGKSESFAWKQGKTIEIPFFYDEKTKIEDQKFDIKKDFSEIIFDFTDPNNNNIEFLDKRTPMFSWTMTAEKEKETKVFSPTVSSSATQNANQEICHINSGMYCVWKDYEHSGGRFYGGEAFKLKLKYDAAIPGKIITLGNTSATNKNFNEFIQHNNGSKFTFRITPLADFQGKRLFTVVNSIDQNEEFPRNFYEIRTYYKNNFYEAADVSLVEEVTNVGSLENIILD